MRYAIRDPRISGLARRMDEMNGLAEQSPGFIWRLPGNEAPEQALSLFDKCFSPFDPAPLFYNLSVWESVEHLKNYVYKTVHVEMLHDKDLWVAGIESAHLTLWWIPEGHRPSTAESAERLQALNASGPSVFAFNFQTLFASPLQ